MGELKAELRKAHAELDRYRQTHARAVTNLGQFEGESTAQVRRLEAAIDNLRLRHRIYKPMTERYALTALRLDQATLVLHRDRMVQARSLPEGKASPDSRNQLG